MRMIFSAACLAVFGMMFSGAAPAEDSLAPTWSQQVEALRPPFIKERKLTSDEKTARRSAMTAAEADPSDAALAALRPLALAGDEDSMQAMVKTYLARQKSRQPPSGDAYYLDVALGGLWGMEYWRLHGADREAALAIDNCQRKQAPAVVTAGQEEQARKAELDCGFRVVAGDFASGTLANYALRKNSAPRNVQFWSWRLVSDPNAELERYRKIVRYLENGFSFVSPWDMRWAKDYARINAFTDDIAALAMAYPEKLNQREKKLAESAKAKSTRLFNRQGTPEELWRYDMADYSRKTSEQKLMLEDQAVAFGDSYLIEYARAYSVEVLREENIQHLCRIADPALCARHTHALDRRVTAVAEAEAKRKAALQKPGQITPNSFGSPSVEVRSYDQNGNYTGSKTMSKTEAELRGARP